MIKTGLFISPQQTANSMQSGKSWSFIRNNRTQSYADKRIKTHVRSEYKLKNNERPGLEK